MIIENEQMWTLMGALIIMIMIIIILIIINGGCGDDDDIEKNHNKTMECYYVALY
jgi:hypothetical protein